jgi:Glycogen recognition site of AMP-activated protein kinase
MSERQRDPDDVFAERLGRVLGRPERFDDDFEHALVAAIQAERPIRYRLVPRARPFTPMWWRTPSSVRLSPIAGLALAAGLAAVAVLGTMRVTRSTAERARLTTASVHDTVTLVRFMFVGTAKSVSVVGDFNRWGANPTPLVSANGVWTASIPLTNGRHEYAFIVDGARWVPDPLAPTSSDEFDTNSSIVTVGT